jgi:8-oxo-dGTP pyrophosphatase MutT (NUDIX family)
MSEDCFHLGIKAIIRDSFGKILLLKTNPKVLKGFKGKPYWDIPGGRIQKDSTVKATLERELEEETGIKTLVSFKPFSMVLSPTVRIPVGDNTVGLILSSYLCDVGKIETVKISDEHVEFGWFEAKEAAKLLEFKYPQEFVEKIASLG